MTVNAPKFRDDIDPLHTWVISDTHWNHANIIEFCHRPEGVDALMIKKWREVVPPADTVLHLGDLCWNSNAAFKQTVAPKLTGARKLLIRGNHDKHRDSFYRNCDFKLVSPFSIPYDDHIVSFSHYPWSESDELAPQRRRDVRIHGHIHNNGYSRSAFVPYFQNHINVSVEMIKYRPINLKFLLDGFLYGHVEEGAAMMVQGTQPGGNVAKP